MSKLQLLFDNSRQFQESLSSTAVVKASHSKTHYSSLFIISKDISAASTSLTLNWKKTTIQK